MKLKKKKKPKDFDLVDSVKGAKLILRSLTSDSMANKFKETIDRQEHEEEQMIG